MRTEIWRFLIWSRMFLGAISGHTFFAFNSVILPYFRIILNFRLPYSVSTLTKEHVRPLKQENQGLPIKKCIFYKKIWPIDHFWPLGYKGLKTVCFSFQKSQMNLPTLLGKLTLNMSTIKGKLRKWGGFLTGASFLGHPVVAALTKV